jgi:hypothetical protein
MIKRIIVGAIGLILIAIWAAHWFSNQGSTTMPIVFTVAGVVVSFIAFVFPLPSLGSAPFHKQKTPKLIVYADKGMTGRVYVLSSDIYDSVLNRQGNPATEMQFIAQQDVNNRPVYGAVFHDLVPEQQYILWIDDPRLEPVPITLPHKKDFKVKLHPPHPLARIS